MSTSTSPTAPMTPDPFAALVGREREQVLLRAALEEMLARRGRLVLIGGEAGVGKTTLAMAMAQVARERGALVLSGGCYDLSTTPPYGPWVDVLRRYPPTPPVTGGTADILPTLPAFLHDSNALAALGTQERMFTSTIAFFRTIATQRPLFVLLDDLQWADQVSLDLLRQFARDLRDLPLLLVATYRSDELTRRHPLYQLLPFLVREGQAERVQVQRLDDAAVRDLLACRYQLQPADEERLVTFLRMQAEGNPLYVNELLSTLVDERILTPPATTTTAEVAATWTLNDLEHVPLPLLIQQVMEVRLAHLDAPARHLLDIAAVLGHSLTLADWQTVSGASDGDLAHALQTALDANLLRPARIGAGATAEDGVEFTHALVREVLHNGILLPQRRALHRRVAEHLIQQPAPDPDRLAYHYQQAGDQAAVQWLIAGGERALHLYAWSTAVQRFDAAAALLEREGPATAAQRGWLRYRAGRLLRYAEPQRAIDDLDAAEHLALQVGDPVLHAFARFDHGTPLASLDQTPQAIALMEAALPDLLALNDNDASIHGIDAIWLADALTPRPQPCPTTLAPGRPGAITSAAIARIAALASAMAQVGRWQESLAMADDFLARPDVQNGSIDIYAIADAHSARGQSLAGLGRVAEARAAYTAERTRMHAAGHLLQVAESAVKELHHVALPYLTDDVAYREQLAGLVEQIYVSTIDSAPSGMPTRIAWIPHMILSGDWANARQMLAINGAGGRVPLIVLGDGCVIARHQGRYADAWVIIRRTFPEGAVLTERIRYFIRLRRIAAEIALDTNDLPTALAWIEVHEQAQREGGLTAEQATDHILRARYHQRAGDLATSLHHAEAAVRQTREPRRPLDLLHAQRLHARLLIASTHDPAFTNASSGDPGRTLLDAANLLDAALALADLCQAPFERALVDVAQAELHLATASLARTQRTDGTPCPAAIQQAHAALDAAAATAAHLDAQPTLTRIAALRERADHLSSTSTGSQSPAPTTPASATSGDSNAPTPATAQPRTPLSRRETDVLRLVADGLTDSDVAARLYISPRTVSTHLTSIYTKLRVSSRTAATRIALDERLI